MPNILDKFTTEEEAQVKQLLQVEFNFIDHPSFHPPKHAEKELFKDATIPEAEVGWYILFLNWKDKVADWNKVNAQKRNVTLTKEQEAMLFLKFNFAKYKFITQARYTRGHGFTVVGIKKLLKWYNVSLKLRKRIAEMNLAMVLNMVRRYRRNSDESELISAANERLMIAIEGFDVSKGFKFSTYAWRAISRCILRERHTSARRKNACPFSFDPDFEEVSNSEETRIEKSERIEVIQSMMNKNLANLTEREMRVIKLRFFEKNAKGKRHGLAEVGGMLGFSRTAIQLAERSALVKLRKAWGEYMD